jgi:hypothetical protein
MRDTNNDRGNHETNGVDPKHHPRVDDQQQRATPKKPSDLRGLTGDGT